MNQYDSFISRKLFSSYISKQYNKQYQSLITDFFNKINKEEHTIYNSITYNGEIFSSFELVFKAKYSIFVSYKDFKYYSLFKPIFDQIKLNEKNSQFLIYCFDLINSDITNKEEQIHNYFPTPWLQKIFFIKNIESNSTKYKEILELKLGKEKADLFSETVNYFLTLELLLNV